MAPTLIEEPAGSATAGAEVPTSPVLAGDADHLQWPLPETFVPPGSKLLPGLYFSPSSRLARRVAAESSGLSSWASWFRPWFLRHGDLQTLVGALLRLAPKVAYDRRLVDTPDGGVVAVDITLTVDGTECSAPTPSIPLVLLIPGLGGSSRDTYTRSMVAALSRRGYATAVINMRGCGRSGLKSARLFSAHRGSTDDVRTSLRYAREVLLGGGEEGASARIYLLGVSNGGTIVVHTLAEQSTGEGYCHAAGRMSCADGGAALSVPHDMLRSSLYMHERSFSRLVYGRAIAKMLVRITRRYLPILRKGPICRWADSSVCDDAIDLPRLLQATSVWHFDDAFTRHVFGYESVSDYYSSATPYTRLRHVGLPLLLLSAANDPVVGGWIPVEEVRSNPNVVLSYTAHGGHIAWQDGFLGRRSTWLERVVPDFFDSLKLWQPEASAS